MIELLQGDSGNPIHSLFKLSYELLFLIWKLAIGRLILPFVFYLISLTYRTMKSQSTSLLSKYMPHSTSNIRSHYDATIEEDSNDSIIQLDNILNGLGNEEQMPISDESEEQPRDRSSS